MLENMHVRMSHSSILHIIFAPCIALLFVFSTPVVGDFKYERTIAFTVERPTPISASSESRDIGGYDRNSRQIYLNIGEALDVITGRFKAPLDGVYYFYYSFTNTMESTTTQISLVKLEDGRDPKFATSQVTQTLTPTIPNPLESASASVLAELKSGDEVYLRLEPGLLDASRERPLLFTGYLIYRESDKDHGGF